MALGGGGGGGGGARGGGGGGGGGGGAGMLRVGDTCRNTHRMTLLFVFPGLPPLQGRSCYCDEVPLDDL